MRYQKTNGALLRRFEYTYDDSNNRASFLSVTPAKAVLIEYGYDWFDRLTSVKRAEATSVAGLGTPQFTTLYAYVSLTTESP